GYAGLLVTRKLEGRLPESASLTLVDDTGTHLVQHELHRAVRDPDYVDDISVPLGELLDRASLREADVIDVDRASRTVSLADGDELGYDYCVIALGATTEFYDIPGVEAHATPLKRLEHAAEIRRGFEAVIAAFGQGAAERSGTVVVGGAGLSGVQVAGELAAMAREHEVADDVEVVLLEQEATVAPGFPEPFQRAARERLDAQGVDVRVDVTVTGADESQVSTESGVIDYDQFVWTGGIRGNEAMGGERPQVRGDLRLDARTFALGDAVRIVDADGEPVPASASAAVRAAETVAHNVVSAVSADGGFVEVDQWHWQSPGWLISVGDDAVAQIGPSVLTGSAANALKSAVGITYLAEHGSLQRALGVLRREADDTVAVSELLKRL
ncbi:MAG: NAD(P)/FAD-dependent oxidoreductase, partial [Halolamina sp.]